MQRRTAFWLLLGILLLGIGLRSYQLTLRSVWFDEAFSWRLIQFPWRESIARTAADVHPPLYYLILKTWSLVFGDTVLALRSFSVTMAGIAIGLTYIFANTAWGRRAGLVAALFIALSAWQIPYAWEIRMYMVGVVLALLSTWLLLKAMRGSSSWVWGWYILSATAFLYVHNFAIFTFLAHALWVVGVLCARTKGRFGEIISEKLTWTSLGSFIAVAILYLPWLPVLLKQTQRVQGNFWIPPLDRWSLPDTLSHFFWPTSHPLAHAGPGLLLTLLPVFGIILLGVVLLLFRGRRDAAWLTVLSFGIPVLGSIIISIASQSVFQERYLIFAECWLFIALAAGVAHLSRRALAISLCVICLFLSVATISRWRELNIPTHPGLRAAMEYINISRKGDEPLFITSPFIFLPAGLYQNKKLAAPDAAKLVSDTKDLETYAGKPIILPQEIVSTKDMERSPSTSIWVIDTTGFYSRENNLNPPWHRQERRIFPEVYIYQGDIIVSHWQRLH